MLWLSFADGKRPRGSQFLGALIAPQDDILCAVQWAWETGLNPSGEVMSNRIDPYVAEHIPEKYKGRLLNKDDIRQFDIDLEPYGKPEAEPQKVYLVRDYEDILGVFNSQRKAEAAIASTHPRFHWAEFTVDEVLK